MTESSIAKLIDRVGRSTDLDARELAERVAEAIQHPDRRVGAALQPKKRGGEAQWRTEQRTERDHGLRDFAVAECGTQHLTPKQARALNRKIGSAPKVASCAARGSKARYTDLRSEG